MTGIFEYAASNGAVLGWAIAFVVFLIIEGVTLNALVSIWFAAAALLAMFAAMAHLSFVWQIIIFAVSSAELLAATRSLVMRLRARRKADPTADHDIGRTATVIEAIDNATGEGRVKLDGVDWAARSADGVPIVQGALVTVRKVDGAKLIVGRDIKA